MRNVDVRTSFEIDANVADSRFRAKKVPIKKKVKLTFSSNKIGKLLIISTTKKN